MRKLKIIEHISLDGVIQASDGPGKDGAFPYGDWIAPYRSPAGLAMVLPEWGERFDLLIGRRTYDQWSGFWPKAPKSPMADRLNAATKYVVTHRPESLEWGPFEGIGSDLVEGVRGIKAKDGPDLIVSGSSTLTSALIEHGLADEMLLLVNPVLLGKGKRLFAEGTPPRAFALESTRATPTGIVANKYKFAGTLIMMVILIRTGLTHCFPDAALSPMIAVKSPALKVSKCSMAHLRLFSSPENRSNS